jgi:hypothetical protein
MEGIDYGFIDISQVDRRGLIEKSSLMWHKDNAIVDVLGNIPHGNKIIVTPELIEQLRKVIK